MHKIIAMKLETGQPAPAFNLVDGSNREVSLETTRGKITLLLFFPFAFTGTCTEELCNIRDNISFYDGLQASVFGISTDAPPSLTRFREEQRLNFPLLSDFNKEASTAFGALYEQLGWMKGVSKRAAFIIDKQGIVQYAEVLDNPGDLPNFEAIQSILKSLE